MKDNHKQAFEGHCASSYLVKSGTSGNKNQTICEEKVEKIKKVLKGDIPSGCSPSFVFWVKKTTKFRLLSSEELNLKDVLCLPTKVKVYK